MCYSKYSRLIAVVLLLEVLAACTQEIETNDVTEKETNDVIGVWGGNSSMGEEWIKSEGDVPELRSEPLVENLRLTYNLDTCEIVHTSESSYFSEPCTYNENDGTFTVDWGETQSDQVSDSGYVIKQASTDGLVLEREITYMTKFESWSGEIKRFYTANLSRQ